MTAQVKSAPSLRPLALVVEETGHVTDAIEAVMQAMTNEVHRADTSVMTVARVRHGCPMWLSAHNATPWRTPKLHCANLRRKPMVKC